MKSSQFWKDLVFKGTTNMKTYLVAQLKLLVLMFIVLAIGLSIIDINFAILIALGISILDLLPVIGSGLVFVPWAIIEWIWGEPTRAWQLALLYILVFILRQIAEPYFIGRDLRLPFWVPVLVTIICSLVFNVFGLLIAAIVIPFISAFWELYQVSQENHNN